MVSKYVKIGMFVALSSVYSTQSFATVQNCDGAYRKTGTVSAVSLGYDDSADQNITFNFTPNNEKVRTISVKRTVDDSSGYGMYQLLLAAEITQSNFLILRCRDNQLAAGEIRQ